MRSEGRREPSAVTKAITLMALRSFQHSIASPVPDENRIIHEVSLSHRYRKMTDWKKRLRSIDLNERPFIDFFWRQNEMSFLNARMSKMLCSIVTSAVSASSHGLVSVIIRCISSMATLPCMLACCSRESSICTVSIQRMRVVTVNSSSSGSSASAAPAVSLSASRRSRGHQNSLMNTTGG